MSSRTDATAVLPPPSTERPGRIWGSLAGWLVGTDNTGGPLVDFPGNTAGPVAARLAIAVDPKSLQAAVSLHQKVVLLFESGDPGRPFLMGLIQETSPTPLVDALLEEQAQVPTPAKAEAKVDGRRVVIEGKDEIVLKCGEASITLRRNGKVIVKGTYLESRATGTHRIKGGSVEIN
ncbi:DUF6484 domain-containing protein [Hyalangium sp.]|uniref:DUF6484 domain-containing protein n=1 Tax=Hyalangium sp. TaxID=2028555 RepID=UPI002D46098D|nr:DUF6484 domain-containing protein [Hyalangium sp.]HYH94981.1 DUF6484 domain-containing protein [Hyalangium sp.]